MCLQGASRAGAELLATLPDARLSAYYVWAPMLPADDEPAARRAAIRFAEPRARHYWDGERTFATRLAQVLGINGEASTGLPGMGFAWDVYLAYRPGDVDLERPDFWMHQLGVQHAPRLNAAVWREHVERLLYGRGQPTPPA